MSGIYIHIPYCTQKCIYCNFYSIATKKSKDNYIKTLIKEIEKRNTYLSSPIKTLYFGGGTPTCLNKEQLEEIIIALRQNFDLTLLEEVTIEANPEDANSELLEHLLKLGFNRISYGIQSFNNEDLRLLNRRHSSQTAINAIELSRKIGFSNISFDLMFNLPNMTLEKWEKNLEKAVELQTEHISCYSLTREEGTMLDKLVNKKIISLPCENDSVIQFNKTESYLTQAGFEHYEISNYCKKGFKSKHNSAYWRTEEYIGLGAAAHSFNISSRSWNPENIEQYISNIENNIEPFTEILSEKDKYNEYIMLSLRTKEGIDSKYIENNFPQYFSHFKKQKEKAKELFKTPWLLNDRIALELMI
ncbi:MAG: radical SAM family heme chaperone HemW [Bacteroidales bacterium]|nr:radical SAM family heme chaperone HemW [Bacteroidales bacterium]